MAEASERTLSAEETEQLARVERDKDALASIIEDLSGRSRRARQLAARVVNLLADREPTLLVPYIDELIDALYRPEAQTRWEVLDALSLLVKDHAEEVSNAYEGAEAALFDELSSTLRLSAFHFLCLWGSTDLARSARAWPIIDEAIQCFHGDLEYRDMLGYLSEFAAGDIEVAIAEELAGRLQFDAENGKGSYLKARSSEIYNALVSRFGLTNPQKRARTVKSDSDADDEE